MLSFAKCLASVAQCKSHITPLVNEDQSFVPGEAPEIVSNASKSSLPELSWIKESPSPAIQLAASVSSHMGSNSRQSDLAKSCLGIVPSMLSNDDSQSSVHDSLPNVVKVASYARDGSEVTVYRSHLPKSENDQPQFVAIGEAPVSAEALRKSASDLSRRKEWDHSFKTARVAECSEDTNIVQWRSAWPFPFSDREYVYLQKRLDSGDAHYLVNVGFEDDKVPELDANQKCQTFGSKSSMSLTRPVFVKDFFSVIAAKDTDRGTCRFVLVYTENLGVGKVPKWAEDYVAKTVIPKTIDGIVSGCKL